MRYYPVCLDVKDRDCLVVGGGSVAARKVKTLHECGASVTVVSPEFVDSLGALGEEENVFLIRRPYTSADIAGRFIVIGATDDEKLNRKISEDSRIAGVICNIADLPDACDFILPSIVDRGDLIISVSTSGKSPAFAKRIRKSLEKLYGEEYTGFLQLMGAIRERLLATEHAPEAHKPIFEELIDSGLLEMVREGRIDEINSLLQRVVGKDYDYQTLMKSSDKS